jgi:hypothetical protein
VGRGGERGGAGGGEKFRERGAVDEAELGGDEVQISSVIVASTWSRGLHSMK